MRYPEMVRYFRRRFNPGEESIYDFILREKPKHIKFLKKRGWDDESINLA